MRELAYASRYSWVAAKEAIGLSRRMDQTFYVDRFARLLKAGSFGRECKITAHGKNDGVGSQAQAVMSAICFANAHGLEYVHRPFTVVLHQETSKENWTQLCEEYFNLGHGARRVAECAIPVMLIDQVLKGSHTRTNDVIVSAQHYLHYCNEDGQAWERSRSAIREKFRHNKGPIAHQRFTVAAHVRRGDVTAEDKTVARNFTSNVHFLNTLIAIKELLTSRVPDARICLHSQGKPQMFQDFVRLGCELHLDEPALATHRQLVESDVLIMSKGGFSYTAAVLNEGITLYDPQKYRPLRDWIVRAPDGHFDKSYFAARVERLLSERRIETKSS